MNPPLHLEIIIPLTRIDGKVDKRKILDRSFRIGKITNSKTAFEKTGLRKAEHLPPIKKRDINQSSNIEPTEIDRNHRLYD